MLIKIIYLILWHNSNRMKKPFALKIEKAINQAIKLRLLLISHEVSYAEVTYNQCMLVKEEISKFMSEIQFSRYLVKKYDLLHKMIPGSHPASKSELEKLKAQAESFIHQWESR